MFLAPQSPQRYSTPLMTGTPVVLVAISIVFYTSLSECSALFNILLSPEEFVACFLLLLLVLRLLFYGAEEDKKEIKRGRKGRCF